MFEIRAVTEKDISINADIIRRSFATVANEFNLTAENCPTNGAFITNNKLSEELNRGVKMFGIFYGNIQIGFSAIEKNDSNTFFLEKLSVIPEHRYKGGGKALLDFSVDYVKKESGKAISIGIIYENKILLKWYEQYGFIITEIKKISHLPFTVCFMKLYL